MSSESTPSVPAQLEAAMKDAGFSRLDMALALKVHPSAITKWLKPDSNITLRTLKRFCDALGMDIKLIKT